MFSDRASLGRLPLPPECSAIPGSCFLHTRVCFSVCFWYTEEMKPVGSRGSYNSNSASEVLAQFLLCLSFLSDKGMILTSTVYGEGS